MTIAWGSTVDKAARRIGVAQKTFYRWSTEYEGVRIDRSRLLKRLESENSRLRRAVADLTLPDTEGGGGRSLAPARPGCSCIASPI